MSLCTYETRNISLADMLVRALPLVSPTSETLIAARLGSCPEEWASRFVVGSLERPGPGAPDLEGCHISRRAAAAPWPVHPKSRPSARRRQLEEQGERPAGSGSPPDQPHLAPGQQDAVPRRQRERLLPPSQESCEHLFLAVFLIFSEGEWEAGDVNPAPTTSTPPGNTPLAPW